MLAIPYIQINMELEVLKEPFPDGKAYYFCSHCNGWIEGTPPPYWLDGFMYYCLRCGNEIRFKECEIAESINTKEMMLYDI